MKSVFCMALLMAAVLVSLPACGQRDREEAKKTSDGSETFKYVPRDPSKYIKKPPTEKDQPVKPHQENHERKSQQQKITNNSVQ